MDLHDAFGWICNSCSSLQLQSYSVSPSSWGRLYQFVHWPLFCITKIMLLFEKCKLSWYKFFVKCFPSISDNVVEHISECSNGSSDKSERDCTAYDCPNDFPNDEWDMLHCFHNVVVWCCSYLLIQRYNKEMIYANIFKEKCIK